jgi:hypothetical protein
MEHDFDAICRLEGIVNLYTDKMFEQLEKHMDFGGWQGCTARFLFRRMYEEMDKARIGIENGASTEYVCRKLTNAANYSMMLADNYCREHTPEGEYKGVER